MEQKFDNNNIDIEVLREFCEREDKEVTCRKAVTFSNITGQNKDQYGTYIGTIRPVIQRKTTYFRRNRLKTGTFL